MKLTKSEEIKLGESLYAFTPMNDLQEKSFSEIADYIGATL